MKEERKTKKELLKDLAAFREEISRLENLKTELLQAQELYRTLANSSYAAVYIVQDGVFKFLNHVALEYGGYQEKEMLGKESASFIHPEDRKTARRNALMMLKGERATPYEFRFVTRDGRIRWILETVTPIFYMGSRAILGNSMDITDQKEARERLEDMEALEASILDALPVAVAGLRERRIIFANRAVEAVFGWKPEELVGKNTRLLYRSDEEYEEIGRHFYPVLEKQRTHSEEYPCRHRDGRDIICMVSTSRIGESLQEKSIVATYEDITERKRIEDLYRLLADNSPIGVYVLQNGAFQYINPRFKESTGFTEDDLLGRDSLSIVHPSDRTIVRENATKMLKGERTSPYEFRAVTKDGRIRWILGTVNSIYFRGSPAVLGNYMDITDQKDVCEKLEDLEALEASILDALPVAVVGLRERGVIFANRAVEAVFGWKPEELIGKNTRLLYRNDEEYEEIGRHFYPVLEKQRTYSEEFTCRHRDGRDIICMVSTSRIGESLQEKSIVATYEDITERKRVEVALKESEGRLSSIIQGSPIPAFVIDRNHRVTHWNRSLEELTGIAAKNIIGTREHWKAFYSQERPCMADLLVDGEPGKVSHWYTGKHQKSKLIEDAYEATDFFPTLGGENKWLRFTAAAIRNMSGEIVGAMETLEDITDQKEAEGALKESESRLRAILEGSPTPTFVIDKNHQVIVWNRAMEELSTIRATEVLHTDQQWRIFYKEKRPVMADILVDENMGTAEQILQWYGGKYVKSELLKDAYEATDYSAVREKWIHFTSAAVRDTSGDIFGAVETLTDISPLKRAEEDLRKSLEKLQKAMTGTVEAMAAIVETRDPYTAGHQLQVAKISRLIAEEMKLPKEQIDALEMAAYIHDIGKIYVPAEILSKPGKLSEVELNIIRIHPQVAYDILQNIEFPWPIADIVYQHHERLNGTGYPRGLKNGDICLEARIIGVVDVFESMASHRPYRPTLGLEKAVNELTKNRGTLYDPAVVDTLLKLVEEKKIELQ